MDDDLRREIEQLKAKIKTLEAKVSRLETNQGNYMTGEAWREGRWEYRHQRFRHISDLLEEDFYRFMLLLFILVVVFLLLANIG